MFIEQICDRKECPIYKRITRGYGYLFHASSSTSAPQSDYAYSTLEEGLILTSSNDVVSVDCFMCKYKRHIDMDEYNTRVLAKKELEK